MERRSMEKEYYDIIKEQESILSLVFCMTKRYNKNNSLLYPYIVPQQT